MSDPYEQFLARRRQRMQGKPQPSPWWGAGGRPMTDASEDVTPEMVAEDEAATAEAAAAENAELDAIAAERDRYLDQLQRTTAEYANYRRRTEQDRERQRLSANEQLLREFVPVLDDFQRGLTSVPENDDTASMIAGLRLVEQKFLNTLRKHGVAPVEALGAQFDPALHEAVEMDPAGGDTVVAVYQPGYRLGDGVLRPAMVKVGPAPAE
ncbi:MAG: nucleotide exchange factor GrpE [Chloroflexota bacterium]|nr:nucleotide exchange factor GrpE [Chloroflexota bacterium]